MMRQLIHSLNLQPASTERVRWFAICGCTLLQRALAIAICLLMNTSDCLATQAGEDRTLEFVAPWPPWVTILLVMFAGILIYSLYSRETSNVAWWQKAMLATLRFSLVCIVLWMMYGFTERPFRTDLPDLLLLVDDSPSMHTVDAIEDADLNERILKDLASVELSEATRLNEAKTLLLKDDETLLKFLNKSYQVKLSGLDVGNPSPPESDVSEEIRKLTTKGEQSRIGEAVRRRLQQQRGRPVAAVLLFTDGITTDGPLLSEVSREAQQRGVPLHIVGLGSESPAKDLKLSDLLVNDVVFVGDIVSFDLTLSASGYAQQSAEVTLRRTDGEGPLSKQSVQLEAEQDSQPIRLTFKAEEQGIFDFVIEVSPGDAEASLENNQLTARIEVRDEKPRVLLVQSYPNFEYHYLRTLLGRGARENGPREDESDTVDLSVLLQDADPQYSDIDNRSLKNFPTRDELFEYDVCIFGDVNPSYLSHAALQDLRDFVIERGRGFIGVAGPRYFPSAYGETPIAELLPFEIRNILAPPADLPIDTGYHPRLTDLGQRMPSMQLSPRTSDNAAIWRELPELYWLLEVDTLKMGIRTLLEHPTRTGTSNQPFPVATLSYCGAGKVLFHYADESWRWRIGRGDEFFGRYWKQTIRYLSRFKLGEGRDVELTSDRESYERGDTVRLRTRFFDDRLAPGDDADVVVMLEQSGARRQQVKLSGEATQRGTYAGDIDGLRTGKYHAWISEPTFKNESPSVDFEVTAPDTELTRLQIDIAEMKRAAKTSGGQFYGYAQANQLLKKLPVGRQVRIESLTPEPIWNAWPIALTFVVLLVTEWLLRRRFGMM